MKIDNREIGRLTAPFVIAEMSANHKHSLERAFELVDAAAAAGVHAMKLQTYTADTMTIDMDSGPFHISDEKSLWKGRSLYNLYQEAYTPWEWHEPILNRCKEKGIIGFSTPFDETAVDFLETLNVPCYKIAAFENTDIPLLKKVASTGKPIIVSTGMATLSELDEAVRTLKTAGCEELILLKCTSNYPADPKDSNVRTIPHMRELFQCEVGLSDHTFGFGAAIAAVTLGASVVEKHFTLSRSDGAVDSKFSMEPQEMETLVVETKRAWEAMGQVSYGPTHNEEPSLVHRRSIYVVNDIQAGETLTSDNIRVIRPGLGLAPKHLSKVLGRVVKKTVRKGTPLSWDTLS